MIVKWRWSGENGTRHVQLKREFISKSTTRKENRKKKTAHCRHLLLPTHIFFLFWLSSNFFSSFSLLLRRLLFAFLPRRPRNSRRHAWLSTFLFLLLSLTKLRRRVQLKRLSLRTGRGYEKRSPYYHLLSTGLFAKSRYCLFLWKDFWQTRTIAVGKLLLSNAENEYIES